MSELFRQMVVFDTAIATHNVGDEIIMEAVNEALFKTFPTARMTRVPSHEKIARTSLSLIRHADYALVGGSNILSSAMNSYPQWKISLLDSLLIRHKVVLLGVGWRNYQGSTNLYTRTILKNLLHPGKVHSVRDSYTENKLRELGITNVLNTGCPTMWSLDEALCRDIPAGKSDTVIFTLTDYDKDVDRDRVLIETLLRNYGTVYYWVQGKRDMEYLNSFGDSLIANIRIVPPNLRAYDAFLTQHTTDYVGTRLHGGIKALQRRRRTIIIGIDNRAKEKAKDFDLPVLDREQIGELDGWINRQAPTRIRLPHDRISTWKSQFAQ